MPFQFPLYKLFLVVAVYAAALGAFSHLGSVGIMFAALVGTAGSLLVIAIRDWRGFVSSAIVAVGSLVGGLFAEFFVAAARVSPYTIKDGALDCVVMAVGAILGGLLFSWASKR